MRWTYGEQIKVFKSKGASTLKTYENKYLKAILFMIEDKHAMLGLNEEVDCEK